jgi:hypothetical protein
MKALLPGLDRRHILHGRVPPPPPRRHDQPYYFSRLQGLRQDSGVRGKAVRKEEEQHRRELRSNHHCHRPNLEMAGSHPTHIHHRRRLRQGPFAGWVSRFGVPATITSDRGAQFTSALWADLCSLTQHPILTHDSLPPSIKRIGQVVQQAAEGRLAVLGCHRRLARPPPLGDAGHQGLLQGRQRIFTGGGSVRLAADSPGQFIKTPE